MRDPSIGADDTGNPLRVSASPPPPLFASPRPPLSIGIDASRATREQRTGTEGYSLYLIRSLLALDAGNDYILYFNATPQAGLFAQQANACQRLIPFPRLWTHLRLSWEMARHAPDVLFVPAHVLPLIHPRRSVVTIHDLGYYREPDAHPSRQRAYLEWATRYNAETATAIIADSQATKRDLVEILHTEPDKIHVIYLGVSDRFTPVTNPGELARVKMTYGIGGPYILYVGTLQPRKNLVRLLEAFSRVVRAVDEGYEEMNPYDPADPPHRLSLVLAGAKGWWYDEVFRAVEQMDLVERVIFPGYVKGDDLPALYSGADLFVLPSLYEGFGLPVLEAMACGTPVVASNVSSLPEIVGDAGVLADPTDSGALARAMIRVLMDPARAADLRERGLVQVRQFTWDRCARETLGVLEGIEGRIS
jgi:glycosyltransferase involved in cell wall biosynthesis